MELVKINELKYIYEIDGAEAIKGVTNSLNQYFKFRNISPRDDQASIIIQEVYIWANKRKVKQDFILWALKKFNDNSSMNISASYILELLEKGYKSEEYRSTLLKPDEPKQIEMKVDYQEYLQNFIEEYKNKGHTTTLIFPKFYEWMKDKFDNELSLEEIYNESKKIVLAKKEKEILGIKASQLHDIKREVEGVAKSDFENMHPLVITECKRFRIERYLQLSKKINS